MIISFKQKKIQFNYTTIYTQGTRVTKYQSNSTTESGARASNQTMRRSLLEPSFRCLLPGREGEREMSAPRPYVTDPFRPLSSINNW